MSDNLDANQIASSMYDFKRNKCRKNLFRRMTFIASGTFADVYSTHILTTEKVEKLALKFFNENTENGLSHYNDELYYIKIIISLNIDNCVQYRLDLLDYLTTLNLPPLVIPMTLYSYTLFEYAKKNKLTLPKLQKILYVCTKFVLDLHNKGYYHNDIKENNVFIKDDICETELTIVIGDYSLITKQDEDLNLMPGAIWVRAPPEYSLTNKKMTLEGQLHMIGTMFHILNSDKMDDNFKDIIEKYMSKNPTERREAMNKII